MTRQSIYLPLFLALAAPIATAQTQLPSADFPEIATSGRGEVRVTPDQAILSIAVETKGGSATAAAADNASRITRAIAAIRSAGVDSAQITTAGYSVEPDYDKNRQIGLIVRNTLRVELRRIADVGKIIDAAVSAGATRVNSVQFQRSNAEDARRTALTMAVADAKSQAEALAQAAGGSLGKLIFLTSGATPSPIGRVVADFAVLQSSVSGMQTPIMPGDLTVAATASARWQFVARKTP